MKKRTSHSETASEQDTMRPEYDFSGAIRGATSGRYAKGTNVVVVERDLLDVFPDSASVNVALRALAPMIRRQRELRRRARTA